MIDLLHPDVECKHSQLGETSSSYIYCIKKIIINFNFGITKNKTVLHIVTN